MKKINILVFVLVFSFSGLFATSASAQVTSNNTYWNGEELVPIDWGNGAYTNDDDNDDDEDNDDDNNDGDEVSTLSATDIEEDSARLEGEVTSGSNVDVWFVIDDNDSTPSCSDDDLEVSVSGDFDDGDEFSRTVSNLDSDETYYFRACSDDDSGNVRSFTTDDDSNDDDDSDDNDNDDDEDNSSEDIIAITTPASGINSNSAYLNGMAVINDGGSATGWFEYGLSTALGSRTPDQSLGDDGSVNISKQLYGLSSNTAYYFRLVVENDSGTDRGDIKALVTSGTVSTTNTGTTTNTNTNNTSTTVTSTTNSSMFGLEIDSNFDKVSVGDSVTFTVSFKNISGKEIKNVIMKVELPEEMIFQKSTLGDFSKSTNSVIVSVAGIPKDVEGEFLVIAEVSKSARGQSVLVASLEGVYDHPSIEGAKLSTIDYSILEVDGGNINQAAGSAFAGKFFPTSFLGWLLIVGVIFLIIIIARKLAKDKEQREEEKQEIKIAK